VGLRTVRAVGLDCIAQEAQLLAIQFAVRHLLERVRKQSIRRTQKHDMLRLWLCTVQIEDLHPAVYKQVQPSAP
jgi:hypothetical protein